jgi:hypothetical protein
MGLDGDGGVGVDRNHRRLIAGDVGGVHHFRGAAIRGRHQAGRGRRQQGGWTATVGSGSDVVVVA